MFVSSIGTPKPQLAFFWVLDLSVVVYVSLQLALSALLALYLWLSHLCVSATLHSSINTSHKQEKRWKEWVRQERERVRKRCLHFRYTFNEIPRNEKRRKQLKTFHLRAHACSGTRMKATTRMISKSTVSSKHSNCPLTHPAAFTKLSFLWEEHRRLFSL